MKNTSFGNYSKRINYVAMDTRMRIIDVIIDPHVKYQKVCCNEHKTSYPVCQTDENVLDPVHSCQVL